MVIEAIAGAAMRLAPEAVKMFDKRLDQNHEIRMQELEFKFATELGGVRGSDTPVPYFTEGAIEAMRETYIQDAAKATRKRYPWVDMFAALVRPAVTYSLLIMHVSVRWFAYGQVDAELFTTVLSFWFTGRVWERKTSA